MDWQVCDPGWQLCRAGAVLRCPRSALFWRLPAVLAFAARGTTHAGSRSGVGYNACAMRS